MFVVPVLVLGLAGLIAGNEMLFAVLTALGIIIGIFLAEYVRRKIGLIRFFGGQFPHSVKKGCPFETASILHKIV
ncbi:MAG TPA: hypothetical protein PLR98_06385 [Chitinophagaceae bacterium]|nr:hypothetical protein [Chitinophagaceae bacterium]